MQYSSFKLSTYDTEPKTQTNWPKIVSYGELKFKF